MTKLTDVLRRLAEVEQDQAAQQAVVPTDVPAAEPAHVAPVSTLWVPERRQATPANTRPDIQRLRELVIRDVRREDQAGGSVLLWVMPPGMEDDAQAATTGLIHELAAALAEGLDGETLVLDLPPAGEQVRYSSDVDWAGAATIGDVIRWRARSAEIVQADGVVRVWRPAADQLQRRLPPAPWPALVALFGQCRQHFAWTLVNGGSWDPAQSAELACRADSVYVVLHEGRTGRIAAQRTLGELRRAGVKVSSCLFVQEKGTGTFCPEDSAK